MIIAPRTPTWKRWARHSWTKYSVWRGLEYEFASSIELRGRILDIGGGKRATYYDVLKVLGEIEAVNVDERYEPTHLCDANQPLPIDSDSYDAVISFNTFEHILSEDLIISEALRVLKPGGVFHWFVPFLYRVHGSPSDFHRHTHHWWEKKLIALGLPEDHQTIEPVVWEPVATAFSLVEFTRLRRFLKPIVMAIGPIRTRRFKKDLRLSGETARNYSDYPLGYYISGRKPAP